MGLCGTCKGITPQALWSPRSSTDKNGREAIEHGYPHLDFDALVVSAASCELCAMFRAQLGQGRGLDPSKKHKVLLVTVTFPSRTDTPPGVCQFYALVQGTHIRAYFDVFADPTDAAALSGDISGRQVPPSADSEEAFTQIKSWLAACDANHQECQKQDFLEQDPSGRRSSRREFPSRLLCIGDDTVKLVDGPDVAPEDYVALSYCWGTSGQLTTTTHNVTSHREGIPLDKLPLTQRQAVAATRRLGLRYLWVDALCIVQDDKSDWTREAPQMGLIYHNAYATIAAAGSSSSAGGLFHPRHPSPTRPIAVPYRRCPSTGAAERTMFIVPAVDAWLGGLQRSVWNSRGWVFQERILSRRVVAFCGSQTFLECQRGTVGEDGKRITEGKRFIATTSTNNGLGMQWHGLEQRWCLLVEDYTARKLTCADDRVMAIESLARYLVGRTASREYCAGAWLRRSPRHLLWYCKDGLAGEPSPRAPSWSWGSVDVPVEWMLWSAAEKACVLELPPDVYGLVPTDRRVQTASLRVEAPVVSIRQAGSRMGLVDEADHAMGEGPYQIRVDHHPGCYQLLSLTGDVIGWGVFDQGGAAGRKPLLAAVLSTRVEHEMLLADVVILTAARERPEHYVRVGVGEVTQLKEEHFARRHITIV
ncbi:hypothetical protein ACRALDRAFT_2051938 [Sodiomyces alcalophilus JCM 7366]|uniref:uncharacterized protein n=1 Tax=Sodiomyces alcalophilus JCM 7366 TaxID=591952 RepID=UPI0039B578E1